MNWLLLAQEQPVNVEKTIGTLEQILKGGVPLICLVIAVAAVIGAVLMFKKNMTTELTYRKDLLTRAKEEKLDAEKRLTDAKQDAKDRAAEVDKLMRERMAAEKESDATLAHAVQIIEANTKIMDRIERKLES